MIIAATSLHSAHTQWTVTHRHSHVADEQQNMISKNKTHEGYISCLNSLFSLSKRNGSVLKLRHERQARKHLYCLNGRINNLN
jgi:hypothetical protein